MARQLLTMEHMAKRFRLLFGLIWVLFLQLHGTQATARPLSDRHPLPLCTEVPHGTPRRDCYTPSVHDLPPCDAHHQHIGFDCSGWPPISREGAESSTTFQGMTRPLLERHIATELPPCDTPHNIIDVDFSGRPPKWRPTRPVARDHVGVAVPNETQKPNGGSVERELPPCKNTPGGIPGWDCYDPPDHPLPPCDFHHQRIGFDCSGWPPAAAP